MPEEGKAVTRGPESEKGKARTRGPEPGKGETGAVAQKAKIQGSGSKLRGHS